MRWVLLVAVAIAIVALPGAEATDTTSAASSDTGSQPTSSSVGPPERPCDPMCMETSSRG